MDPLQQSMKKWGLHGFRHDPIHPHLAPDTKTFTDSLRIGAALEELTKRRMDTLFEALNCYCDRITTDLDDPLRVKGKRIRIKQQDYIAPDYAVSTGGEWYWVDLKGKQFHSYYHKTGQVQQRVDVALVADYLTISAYYRKPILLLMHLWPAALMEEYGHGETARIHTGLRWDPLTEDRKKHLLSKYPVNDWYYLINAAKVKRLGRVTRENGRDNYFFDIRHAIKGPSRGQLPSLRDWAYAAHRDL